MPNSNPAMVVYVRVDVDLQFKLGPPSPIAPGLETFEVCGPSSAVRYVSGQVEPAKNEYSTGFLSPRAPVTLPDFIKIAAGIPLESAFFAFAYALDCLKGDFEKLVMENAANPREWLEALLIGAFCYFDKDGKLIRINSLALTPTPGALRLDGGYPVRPEAARVLKSTSRMRPLTLGSLEQKGFATYAWVNPSECPGGQTLLTKDTDADWMHGCFVYQTKTGDAFCFRIDPTPDPVPFKGVSTKCGDDFCDAMIEMHTVTYDALDTGKLLAIELAKWRQGPVERWLRSYGVAIPMYYLVGIWFYGWTEGWAPIDVIYYLTVTSTTVGYGDLSPATPMGRLFTTFYAPAGCIFVIVGLMGMTAVILDFLCEQGLSIGYALEKCMGATSRTYKALTKSCRAEESKIKSKKVVNPFLVDNHLLAKYFSIFFSPILLMLFGVLYAINLDGMSVIDACYFTLISMTTIGYGDICPEDDLEKLVYVIFLPLATAALGNTIGGAGNIGNQQTVRQTNWKLKSLPLLLERCDGDCDRGLTDADFLGATLIDMGIVDDEILQVIAARFKEVAQGSEKIDSRVVYRHLVDASQVLDIDNTRGMNPDGSESLPHVNLCAKDLGYSEWYEKYWKADVAAAKIAGDLVTSPVELAMKEAARDMEVAEAAAKAEKEAKQPSKAVGPRQPVRRQPVPAKGAARGAKKDAEGACAKLLPAGATSSSDVDLNGDGAERETLAWGHPAAPTPRNDSRIDALLSHVAALNTKLDAVCGRLPTTGTSSSGGNGSATAAARSGAAAAGLGPKGPAGPASRGPAAPKKLAPAPKKLGARKATGGVAGAAGAGGAGAGAGLAEAGAGAELTVVPAAASADAEEPTTATEAAPEDPATTPPAKPTDPDADFTA